MPSIVPVVIFVLCYALFIALPRHRSWVALSGAALLVILGVLSWHEAFLNLVQWNVIGLFFGTLLLAELFMQSRMPAVIAEVFVEKTKTVRGSMLALGAPVPVLMFALLIGSCLGGNITPIGASANVVTVGLLRKRGYTVTFREFMAVGIPFTVAAVIASAIFVWFVWKP